MRFRALRFLVACSLAAPTFLAAQTASIDTGQVGGWSAEDWHILSAKVRWAGEQRLDTLPLALTISAIARSFVGTPYRPGTLERPGPERLVINLRELDCVTFVENVLALTAFVRRDGVGLLADPAAARERYAGYLRQLRYRGGTVNGYASRLHYFSDWLGESAAAGRLKLVTAELGGVADAGPVDFMTTHAGSYPALQDTTVLQAVREQERRLTDGAPRIFLPKDRIAAVADSIQEGDVIAVVSTLPGLDVVHTGFAVWERGRLHLLHAPLVGSAVEISVLPLAERIQGISSQRGIMVARPRPGWFDPPR